MKLGFENFGKRFCAYLLDVLILSVSFIVFSFLNNAFNLLTPYYYAGACYLLTVLYFSCMESGEYQATLGKRVLGLMVVRSDGEEGISFARAFVRNVARLVNMPIYCLGYLPILFTKKRQGLHDMIARTTVVPVDYEEEDSEEESDEENE